MVRAIILSIFSTGNEIQYDSEWHQLEYLVSTRETAFEMKLLERLDVELLIGQVLVHI